MINSLKQGQQSSPAQMKKIIHSDMLPNINCLLDPPQNVSCRLHWQ